MTLLKRIMNKLKRLLQYFGFLNTVREFKCIELGGSRGRLLIVCPGNLSIPPEGWGAVELLIHESIPNYKAEGYEVWILNSRAYKDWKQASKQDFKLILNHSDADSPRIRQHWPNAYVLTVTHYGLAAQPEKWHKSYRKVLRGLTSSDKIICLSPAIQNTFLEYFEAEKLLISPNGSSFQANQERMSDGPILYLGKVEKRKRQYEVWNLFKNSGRDIIFAGPIIDERVLKLIKSEPSSKLQFIGEIDRESLPLLFSRCSSLMLISEGEADALVLYEAQIAGLPILINSESLGSQDPRLPWVRLISNEPKTFEIAQELESVANYNHQISTYAKANYSWDVRNCELIQALNEVSGRVKQ